MKAKEFLFLQTTFSMKTDPEKTLSHAFEIRMKTQILATLQTEARGVTWKSKLLTHWIQTKNGIWRQICIWGETEAPDGNVSKVWYESKSGWGPTSCFLGSSECHSFHQQDIVSSVICHLLQASSHEKSLLSIRESIKKLPQICYTQLPPPYS